MKFGEFSSRAHEMFDEIPAIYREGIDSLSVSREVRAHPELPEIYTLGECVTEAYPSEFGGAGDVRSRVVIYYGSFRALSKESEDWGWEEELWETITHEVQHHLESLASEEALEIQDYAEDQNFARREGRQFDRDFYRMGHRLENDVYSVDGDVFVERTISDNPPSTGERISFSYQGEDYSVDRPEKLRDVNFVIVDEGTEDEGELILVLVRRRGLLKWMRGILRGKGDVDE
ncbi:MAG TPA: metallopeptidase family protein [Longimicrobiaceae bacterium]|nr:metallopeptidase family protein [Longimicrobiaceae bacterium]